MENETGARVLEEVTSLELIDAFYADFRQKPIDITFSIFKRIEIAAFGRFKEPREKLIIGIDGSNDLRGRLTVAMEKTTASVFSEIFTCNFIPMLIFNNLERQKAL